MIKAIQAIISTIRHACFVCLYFLIKVLDFILSEVRCGVSGGAVCSQWEFLEGANFCECWTKFIYHFGAKICSPSRLIIKFIQRNMPWKTEKTKLNMYAILYYEKKIIYYWKRKKTRNQSSY